MSSVKRIYVEKKKPYAAAAKELLEEIGSYLGITAVTDVRVLVRYDVEGISEETYKKALTTVFSEAPVDDYYEENFDYDKESDRVFSVEYLPGQFDQRADSAVQCIGFLNEKENVVIKSATTYVIKGNISDEEFDSIRFFCINPVDSRETGLEKPETLVTVFDEPEAGIDLWSFNNLIKVFEELHETSPNSLIIISHQERILNIADEIVVIANGSVKADRKSVV